MTWIRKRFIAAEAEKERQVLKREVEGFSNSLNAGEELKNKVKDNTTRGLMRGKEDNSISNRDSDRMGKGWVLRGLSCPSSI